MKATEKAPRGRRANPGEAEPRSWDDVGELLGSIGEADRQIQGLSSRLEGQVAVLKQQWVEASRPLEAERRRLRERVERFYWAHRAEVLAAGRKSVETAFGRLGSRNSRRVVVEDAAAAQEWLLRKGLHRYLRTRTEVDREAVRAALLGGNDAGEGNAAELLNCPALSIRESEEFWYEVTPARRSATLPSGHPSRASNENRGPAGTRKVLGTSRRLRPRGAAVPASTAVPTVHSGGAYVRAIRRAH